jgi:hypothetical protein
MDKNIWCFYNHMPHHWITDIHCHDYTPRVRNILELDTYLKNMGFTGIPQYQCSECKTIFTMADDCTWACTFAYLEYWHCIQCGAKGSLVQVKNEKQLQL